MLLSYFLLLRISPGSNGKVVEFLINYKKTNIFSPLIPSNLLYFYLYRPWILTYSALAIGVENDAFEDFFPTTFLFSPKTIGQGFKQAQEYIGKLELENLSGVSY